MSPPPEPVSVPDYDKHIDFHELVQQDADFKKILVDSNGVMNWKDPGHLMQLTKSLLKRDFKLTIELPNDRLCPPVPGRYSYIKWLQGLLDTTSRSYVDGYDAERKILGIDIGVGSSCIYALLGTTARPSWRMYGTELDEKNFQHAQRNIAVNNLTSRIRLLRTSYLDALLPLDKLGVQRADFTMCNPPFYTSVDDMRGTETKAAAPSAVCTGAEVEMVTEGGDAGFVVRMVDESQLLGRRVQWYSSMLGKLSSVSTVVARLKELDCKNWAIGCLMTGGKTRRWVVGWSWSGWRPQNGIARGQVSQPGVLPYPTEFTIPAHGRSNANLIEGIDKVLNDLELRWDWDRSRSQGLVRADGNVWSRSARRRKQRESQSQQPPTHDDDAMDVDEEESSDTEEESENAFAARIQVTAEGIIIRWLYGFDSVVFESFCGMVKRSLVA